MTQIETIPCGNYPVYDASGITRFINEYDIDNEYIAIIKDGSGVGKLQFCQSKSSFIGTLGGLVAKHCSSYFLYSALQNIEFQNYVTGMAIPHIYWKDFKKISIPLPNNDTMTKIENVFKLLDDLITFNKQTLQHIRRIKDSLLQQLFI